MFLILILEAKLLLSLLFGGIGAFDSVALVLGNRAIFRSARFALAWALGNGAAHSAMKTLGAVLGPLSAAWWLRGGVFALSAFVLFQALSHLKHDHGPKARWQLWLPAIALGSLDALPVSFTKGLVVDQSVEGLILSTAVVVLLPFLVSLFGKRQRSGQRSRTAGIARVAHFSIFCWIVPFVVIEQFLALTEACLASTVGAIVLFTALGLAPARQQLKA